ncbi:uncharacterized protein BO88DRAFT_166448 [Aspergillus vadensis CBS 113365]|uniref:Uncharacterized protein n=1 Tax=Aspergillus vadensis (strain CBS 113365 / IMI 142717 / IBT 24658) TaxID=1448311 RepID=A0A319BK21_ASPVC|nr:hypothetical protein BO88DRAFT_166448 [Aspergillus vadensis CBS 113365]PYH72614.1 hypothetical protein BO88DRAFT_166448 [Aspergillus vadensis CBS 113365]
MDFRAPLQLEGILPIKTHCPPISSSSSSSLQSLQLPAELSASTENPRLLSFTLFRPEHETATPPYRRLICRLESSSQEAKLHTSSSSLSRASSHTSSSPPTSPQPASVRGRPSPGFRVGQSCGWNTSPVHLLETLVISPLPRSPC